MPHIPWDRLRVLDQLGRGLTGRPAAVDHPRTRGARRPHWVFSGASATTGVRCPRSGASPVTLGRERVASLPVPVRRPCAPSPGPRRLPPYSVALLVLLVGSRAGHLPAAAAAQYRAVTTLVVLPAGQLPRRPATTTRSAGADRDHVRADPRPAATPPATAAGSDPAVSVESLPDTSLIQVTATADTAAAAEAAADQALAGPSPTSTSWARRTRCRWCRAPRAPPTTPASRWASFPRRRRGRADRGLQRLPRRAGTAARPCPGAAGRRAAPRAGTTPPTADAAEPAPGSKRAVNGSRSPRTHEGGPDRAGARQRARR